MMIAIASLLLNFAFADADLNRSICNEYLGRTISFRELVPSSGPGLARLLPAAYLTRAQMLWLLGTSPARANDRPRAVTPEESLAQFKALVKAQAGFGPTSPGPVKSPLFDLRETVYPLIRADRRLSQFEIVFRNLNVLNENVSDTQPCPINPPPGRLLPREWQARIVADLERSSLPITESVLRASRASAAEACLSLASAHTWSVDRSLDPYSSQVVTWLLRHYFGHGRPIDPEELIEALDRHVELRLVDPPR